MNHNPYKDLEEHSKLFMTDKYLDHTGFPRGTTVDDLFLTRRKRATEGVGQDHLKLESGSKSSEELWRNRTPHKDVEWDSKLFATDKYVDHTGFPLGTTVDDLSHFRRKRATEEVGQDHIKLDDGSNQANESEYTHQYPKSIKPIMVEGRRRSDSYKDDGDYYHDSYVGYPIGQSNERLFGIPMEVNADSGDSEDAEWGRHLYRRPIGQDIWNATERIKHLLPERAQLLNHPTTLKMEGNMGTHTESGDNYLPYEHQSMRHLLRADTNIHLDDAIDISSENREKLVPIPLQPLRPPRFARRSTNLDSEHGNIFLPYKGVKWHPETVPMHNIHGFLEPETEHASKCPHHDIPPVVPVLRDYESGKKIVEDVKCRPNFHLYN